MPIATKYEIKTKQPEEIMREFGQSGTVITAGEIWNADYNTALEGRDGMDVWEKLIKSDSTVKLCLDTVEQNIASTQWYIKPGGEDEKDKEVAKWLTKMLFEDMQTPFQQVLFNMMPFGYGCSLNEPMYDVVDGKLVITDIRERLQKAVEKWISKNDASYNQYVNVTNDSLSEIREYTQGSLMGMEQMLDNGRHYFIPKQIPFNGQLITKLLLISNEIEGENYWGQSIFRAAYRNWYFRDKLYKIHGMMTEKQGVAPVVAVVNPDMSQEDKDKIQEALSNFGKANQEKYIYLEAAKDMVSDIFVMDMKADQVAKSLEDSKEHKMSIAEAVDLDWKTNEGKGSYQKDLLRMSDFLERENTRAALIRDSFNRQVLFPVIEYNFPGLERKPSLEFEKIQYENVPETVKTINELIKTKSITVDNEVENTLRGKLGLKELPEEMEEVDRTVVTTNPFEKPMDDKDDDRKDEGNSCGNCGDEKLNMEFQKLLLETEKVING